MASQIFLVVIILRREIVRTLLKFLSPPCPSNPQMEGSKEEEEYRVELQLNECV